MITLKLPKDWKYKTIGEIAQEVSIRNDENENLPVLSCTKHDGLVDSLKYFGRRVFSEDISTYKVVPHGCFAYATNHIEEGSIGYQDAYVKALISPIYTVFKTCAEIHDAYLFFLFKTELYRHIFEINTSASVDRRGSLRWKEFSRITIPIPPVEEQKRIAKIISTWDYGIDFHDKVIFAKKKEQVFFRQKYLTGKRRIPGFNGKWQDIKLENVLTEHGALSSGKEEVCSVSVHKSVVNQYQHLGRVYAAADTSNYNLVKPGDIIYTKSPTGDFPFGIIKQSLTSSNVIVSPLYGVFTPATFELGTIIDFYFESSVNAVNYLRPIIQKGAKNTINITNKTFLSRSLLLPCDVMEQKVIAKIITTKREEIKLLEEIREKYKQQKKGLMQKLLTGKTRVKA